MTENQAKETILHESLKGLNDTAELLEQAEKILLALDYDGTLAPFHVDRMKAFALPEALDAVDAIGKNPKFDIAIVSGRPIEELLTLLGKKISFHLIGSHGWEQRYPDSRMKPSLILQVQKEGLMRAAGIGVEFGFRALIEEKAASVALHTRPLDEKDKTKAEARILKAWRPMEYAHKLEVRRFNGGVEIRATGRDKGVALTELLAELGEPFPLYIGDDDTDEDAFRLVNYKNGLSVKVGEGGSLAKGRLPDCHSVARFLKRLASL